MATAGRMRVRHGFRPMGDNTTDPADTTAPDPARMQLLPTDGPSYGSKIDPSGMTVSVRQLQQSGYEFAPQTLNQFIQQIGNDPWSKASDPMFTTKPTVDPAGPKAFQLFDPSAMVGSVSATTAATAAESAATSAPAPVAAANSGWLSSLLTWLPSPVSSSVPVSWGLLLLVAAAGLYLMRDEQ